jgi:hypothetical protein
MASFLVFFGFLKLLVRIRESVRASELAPVFVDTTGACLPIRSLILRGLLRGLWCFDIYDDLLYDLRSVQRLQRKLNVWLLAKYSSLKFVLSRDTLRLFPDAYHLDNAAHTRRINRSDQCFSDLVILFFIDKRFDFKLVRDLAEMVRHLKIHLYGRLYAQDCSLKPQLEELCAKCPNVIYHGEYRFDDVEAIISPFGIGFTPYIVQNALTEFINPDKYYLFLNSGMEVISTDIPQARRLTDCIHIVRSPREILTLVGQIQSDPSCRKNKDVSTNYSWELRADQFIKIIESVTPGFRLSTRCKI